MKVYEIVPTSEYVAGVAIIAADNANVAISLWKQDDEQNDDLWYEGHCNCFERKELTANVDNPKVLIDTIVSTYPTNV